MKKILCVLAMLCLMTSSSVYAEAFFDVTSENENYDAIIKLGEKGVINGYEDGTFRPDSYISRAEAATIIVRAADFLIGSSKSMYADVSKDFWGCKYITAATDAGIISGMGNGLFAPNDAVTYNQIIKMAVCMAGFEDEAIEAGGWPDGYAQIAFQEHIISHDMRQNIRYYNFGNKLATRGDVAGIVYNALKIYEKNELYIGDKKLYLEMSADFLDAPDEVLLSTAGFEWYVYGIDNYKGFYAVGVYKNKVVALASAGKNFEYRGYSAGDVMPEDESFLGHLYGDKNDENRVHAVLLMKVKYDITFDDKVHSDEQFADESRMNLHFTNAFRVMHGQSILKWSDKAARSAKLHSKDMAEQNYFSHTGLDGLSSSQRMINQGIDWMMCGENIAAGGGRFFGFHSYNGWVNSAGHRANMLEEYEYLGVGIHYNPDSQYGYYHTQNFYK